MIEDLFAVVIPIFGSSSTDGMAPPYRSWRASMRGLRGAY